MYKILTLSFIGLFLSAGVAFACVPQVTIPEPSIEISPSISPSVDPSVEPSTEPSVIPSVDTTVTPEAKIEGVHVDMSDGRSDGLHQAPDGLGCAVHECKAPLGPPATGRGL